MKIIVNKSAHYIDKGILKFGFMAFPCALGRSGRGVIKREGDGKTPIGKWRFLRAFYRADRLKRPKTKLPMFPIHKNYGWCDMPWDNNYNRFVHLPYSGRSERLWRDDHLYDIIVVLNHNHIPRIHNYGSAIFMHVEKNNYQPTEGCVALRVSHLKYMLTFLSSGSELIIN